MVALARRGAARGKIMKEILKLVISSSTVAAFGSGGFRLDVFMGRGLLLLW